MFKKLLVLVSIIILTFVSLCFASSIETKISNLAIKRYPDNIKMQEYVYHKQITGYNYMAKVPNRIIKKIAIEKYPNDYVMQKYVYDNQFKAYLSMSLQPQKSKITKIAISKYPDDYVMQKYVFDKQFKAFRYLFEKAKKHPERYVKVYKLYPNNYELQKHVYDKYYLNK